MRLNNVKTAVCGKSKPVKKYRNFWVKELDSLLKQRRDANRLKRLHDKTMFSDNDLGKHINTLYRNRKLKVQEAIKRKEQVFQMKQFNDKCINTKNKMKGFLNFIKGHNYVNSPSQVLLVVS